MSTSPPDAGQGLSPQAQGQPLRTISVPQIASQPNWTGTLSNESLQDTETRLRLKEDDERHKRWRSSILFAATLVGVIFVFGLCVRIIGDKGADVNDKKWATAIMTSIVTGGIGYLTGKAIA